MTARCVLEWAQHTGDFTDDPMPASRMLRRSSKGWQLDAVAAVRDVRLLTGGPYT